MSENKNVDPAEVSKFAELAHLWWDTQGSFKPLHDINPVRASYIDEHMPLAGKKVLDVGCGGGILTEEMHRRGGLVTGIDAAASVVKVAQYIS